MCQGQSRRMWPVAVMLVNKSLDESPEGDSARLPVRPPTLTRVRKGLQGRRNIETEMGPKVRVSQVKGWHQCMSGRKERL